MERGGQKCVILEETKYILSQYIVLFKYDILLLDIDYSYSTQREKLLKKETSKDLIFLSSLLKLAIADSTHKQVYTSRKIRFYEVRLNKLILTKFLGNILCQTKNYLSTGYINTLLLRGLMYRKNISLRTNS